MIKTSVIVPVYNTAEYLEECFESIFGQTQKEIEVIAINDGSTDNSLQVLKEIQKKYPQMIILSQKNKGLGETRNIGLELAKGEFIYFIDSDDCLINIALETCYSYAKKNQLDVVMFDANVFGNLRGEENSYDRTNIITEQKQVVNGVKFANKYWLKSFCPSACLIYTSAEFLRKNRLKFLSQIYYEDNEFYCKLIPLAKRIMYIPLMLYRRRFRSSSITTSSFDIRHANDYLQIVQAINKQNHNIDMQLIIHEVLLGMLKRLITLCEENDLLNSLSFANEFFETALSVCGGNIQRIDSHRDLRMLCQLCNVLLGKGIISNEMERRILDRKEKVLECLFQKLSFQLGDQNVGIYGTGIYSDQFIEEYQKKKGGIKANLIFIESNVASGKKKYKKYNVVNVNDIENLFLEYIIVASSKFEQEICDIIREKYGNRFNIIRLQSDLHF